jgi:Fuc2NAc and GlcNAc transferase
VAATGWWDDLRSVSARWRFGLYWLFSLAALGFVAGAVIARQQMPVIPLLALLLLCSAAMQWLINLYNFMDGINGIAAVEALFVLGSILLLGADTAYFSAFQWLLGCSIVVLCGFLFWNFPVAQVFMGDAGSAFLGFLLGILMVWATFTGGPDVIAWLILLGAFIVDATYTLVVRIATGQMWHQPHRLHAYQILSRRLGSHAKVVGLLAAVNIGWLLPWAWAAHRHWISNPCAILLAYLPLLAICCSFGAGNPARTRV